MKQRVSFTFIDQLFILNLFTYNIVI